MSNTEAQLLMSLSEPREDHLETLKKRADRIRGLLDILESSPGIYQNLPLNSAAHKVPRVSPEENIETSPPPLPPRLSSSKNTPPLPPPPPISRSHSSTAVSHEDSKSLAELKEERKRLISLHLQEARRHFSELEEISKQIKCHKPSNIHHVCSKGSFSNVHSEEFSVENERHKDSRKGSPTSLSRDARLSQSSNNILERVNYPHASTIPHSSSVSNLNMSHHRSANLEQLYHEALPLHKVALLSHSGPPVLIPQDRFHGPSSSYRGGPASSSSERGSSHHGGSLNGRGDNKSPLGHNDEAGSVISFISSIHSVNDNMSTRRREDIDSKIDGVNSLVSLLGCTDIEKMSMTFLAMSSSQAKCDLMRSHHVIPLLVQLLHGSQDPSLRPSREIRFRLSKALSNIVHSHPSDKQCKREAKVLKLLESLRMYSDFLRDVLSCAEEEEKNRKILSKGCGRVTCRILPDGNLVLCDFGLDDLNLVSEEHVIRCHNFVHYADEAFEPERIEETRGNNMVVINVEETMAILTRCSFDEGHRQPIFMLGGIPVLAELIKVEREAHELSSGHCTEVRRFAVVALTNLTFGNANIKSFLCSLEGFVPIMVAQLNSPYENLRKATAHLFRNLAWKADKNSRQVLSDSSVVQVLMKAAMDVTEKVDAEGGEIHAKEEPTLKVILSALWNLSAHSRKNKADICTIEGVFPFLVHLLKQKFPSVVESAGGIMRNISSYIATSPNGEEYRAILREYNCLAILLSQLKSPSLTIVSNSCGTLWNFSARNSIDQKALWDMGAVPMLQSLTNSKHKTISTCSLAALKNLFSYKPFEQENLSPRGPRCGVESSSASNGGMPSLEARKKKNFLSEMKCKKLTETCEDNEEDHNDSDLSSSSSSVESHGSDEDEDRRETTSYHHHASYTPRYMKVYEDKSKNDESLLMTNYLSSDVGNNEEPDLLDDEAERPTDYSLRFQEEEEEHPSPNNDGNHGDENISNNVEDSSKNVDSVKTYCMEGTPYDTPFAPISTATSMGDLHQAQHDEKPLVYCTEDTPGCYSRADSLSSLDSIEHPNNESGNDGCANGSRSGLQSITEKEDEGEEKGKLEETESEKKDAASSKSATSKTVTFQPHETPLMFSRASSFESLNSFDQCSIRDGYSSCDFSRATSGRVSPSDLPDSPCQSRPRTPPSKRADEEVRRGKQNGKHFDCSLSSQQQQPQRPLFNKKLLNTVFEDGVQSFKEEGTPAHFSTRTSLSNLTFSDDDDGEDKDQTQNIVFPVKTSTKVKNTNNLVKNDTDEEEDIYADSESILEAVITSGMPNTRDAKTSKPPSTISKSRLPRPKSSSSTITDNVDSVKKFRTEDTPDFLSHAGSNSNLSELIVEDEDDSDEDLLEACIKAAMPITNKNFTGQLSTPLGQREDGEGAPSSGSSVSVMKKPNPFKLSNPAVASNRISIVKPVLRSSTLGVNEERNSRRLYSTSESKSGHETPLHFATEDTPLAYSRNDSLSSLSCEDEKVEDIAEAGSLLPRPRVLGRSESSGSSQKSNFPNRESSMSNDSLQQDDADANLLEDCINSGMPKSKSEPLGFNRGGLKLSLKSDSVKRREKKKRDNSKSPRGSKIIPGVRIAELKLIPKKQQPSSPNVEEKTISPKNRLFTPRENKNEQHASIEVESDLQIKDIEFNQMDNFKRQQPKKNLPLMTDDCPSIESSLCSNISNIQPPSIMDSLISISEKRSELSSPQMAVKLECRHTLSAKKGYTVPEMVRRAINPGVSKGVSNEDISSLSSCHSNLENIKPPTLIDDMDNSILSIASISSEIASGNMGSSAESGSNPGGNSLNSEQIFDLIKPEADEIRMQCIALSKKDLPDDNITTLDDIGPPSILDEITNTDKTLVPEALTYTVNEDDCAGQSTCHDITDVFDEETVEPTLTLGSTGDADEAPELPRDSRRTTPATSGGESSRESTPQSKRKLMEQFLNYKVTVPELDPMKSEENTTATTTSGYKSIETLTPPKSSVQRRKEDIDRFKTHTITKDDISPRKSDSDCSSPKSIKQRRSEEADRFRTRTITPADLVKPSMEPDMNLLNQEARLIAEALSATKPRSRSRSIELLNDEELKKDYISEFNKPRIRKPSSEDDNSSPVSSPRSIRGRRKPLYSSPRRSTVPPSIPPKPKISPRPSLNSKMGLRSRTASSSASSITSSRVSPRGTLGSSSSTSSSIRSTSSKTSVASSRVPVKTKPQQPPPLVRQGTFTKEEDSSNRTKVPGKSLSRPSSRSSMVRAPSPSVAQTRTSALRERSASRGRSSTTSLNSSRSSKSSLKTSTSNQSLRTVTESNIPKRAGAHHGACQHNTQISHDTRSESGGFKKGNKKEVTSRIASLWKKVEDSKKKNKQKEVEQTSSGPDKRIWISKGKVIPENERALLRVHEEQRRIIKDFKSKDSPQRNNTTSTNTGSKTPRSRSRLSIRLSKFSLNKKEKTNSPREDKSPVDSLHPLPPTSAIVPPFNYNPPVTTEDEEETSSSRSRSVVKRNDSYVSSMGRIPSNESPKKETPSASVMVTLV